VLITVLMIVELRHDRSNPVSVLPLLAITALGPGYDPILTAL
jgi:hypothetical protein